MRQDGKVQCIECEKFKQGFGSEHALGTCQGEPWGRHKGQWPFMIHPCKGFEPKPSSEGEAK